MWLDPIELSRWAYEYCLFKEDKPEIRKYITESYWAYTYCKFVKDRPEIRKLITSPCWIYRYCKFVRLSERSEGRKYIKGGECG